MRRLLVLAAVCAATMRGGAGTAGEPPRGARPAVLYTDLSWPDPARAVLAVQGRVEFAASDSLDLERRLAECGRLPRLEVFVSADPMVLHPHVARPERYRTVAPSGAPLQWQYELVLARVDTLPVAAGDGWVCVHLGGVLLVPRVPGGRDARPESVAVQEATLRLQAPAGGRALAPWPGAALRPDDAGELADEFAALGAWSVTERVVPSAAGSCSLQVAAAGFPPGTAPAWGEPIEREIVPLLAAGGRALVCVVPAAGAPQAFVARRSALVRWPAQAPPPGALAASARRVGGR